MKQYRNQIITVVITLIIGVILGAIFFGGKPEEASNSEKHDHTEPKQEVWTCSMHPQIRQPEPGQCPICGMDLILLNDRSTEGIDPDAIQMTNRAMKLADIQTSIVGKGSASKNLQLTGKVQEDERSVYNQTAHFPGRIEKLFVNFTGEYISKGQKIASIYSPDLVTAQEELFEAQKFGNNALVRSAKKKLKLWKLSDAEIDMIVKSGKVMTEVPVRADVSGVVTAKKVNLGSHVMEGGVLFEVANLSKVWVVFDAYETDLQWIEIGDSILFTTPSVPGKAFQAKATFIDPLINPKTRVALVRTDVDNSKGILKPEMLVNGELKGGRINQGDESLTIPKSAVMWTGKRSVVYVKVVESTTPAFIMREVVLGPALGDSYIISEGLQPGEEIVTNGTFTIDAAAQLQGKKSMMNPEGGPNNSGHNHGGAMEPTDNSTGHAKTPHIHNVPLEFRQQLSEVVRGYFKIKDALVNSNPDEANKEAYAVLQAIEKVEMGLLEGEAHMHWMELVKSIKAELESIRKSADIESQRKTFIQLSQHITTSLKTFGIAGDAIYVQRCPMADNNKGASWLSSSKVIENPYFGEAMLKCGEVVETIK